MKLPRSNRSTAKPGSGFTMIELMITLAVLAIILAIAIPAYDDQVRRSRRAQAQATLAELVQCMERYNTTNGTYVGGDAICTTADTDFYLYTVAIPNRNTFVAGAEAHGGQASDSCGNLGINQAGQKTHSAGSDCWR